MGRAPRKWVVKQCAVTGCGKWFKTKDNRAMRHVKGSRHCSPAGFLIGDETNWDVSDELIAACAKAFRLQTQQANRKKERPVSTDEECQQDLLSLSQEPSLTDDSASAPPVDACSKLFCA